MLKYSQHVSPQAATRSQCGVATLKTVFVYLHQTEKPVSVPAPKLDFKLYIIHYKRINITHVYSINSNALKMVAL